MDNKTIIEWGWVSPEELWRAQWITAEADFLFPPAQFYYFPSSMFFIPLLHLHLLIYSIYFSTHKYIDLLSTLHRPHIDPTPNFFCNTASWIVKLYTTTATTFLLFPLHHHHHHHHISDVIRPPPPPPPHFNRFLFTTTTATTFQLFSLHHYRHHIFYSRRE